MRWATHVAGGVEALDPGDPLGLADAHVVEVRGALLLLDLEVLAFFQEAGDPVGLGVLLHVVEGGSGDDEGGPGLVHEDGVDLVDHGVVQGALRLHLAGGLHVVAEVVEPELVVGAVGDVAAVDLLARVGVHLRLDRADGEAEAVVERAHPLGVAAGEVVVDGHDVDALALQGVEVDGQGGDEGLPFARDHLGDVAAVEDHPAHELDVVVPHLEEADAPLAADREGFDEDIFERLALGQAVAELGRLGGEGLVGERLHGGLERVDLGDVGAHPADLALIGVAEEADEPLGDGLGHGGEAVGRLVPDRAEQFPSRSFAPGRRCRSIRS